MPKLRCYTTRAANLKPKANLALAYAGLADSYAMLALFEMLPPEAAFPRAKAATLKSLAIDEELAEAMKLLAQSKRRSRRLYVPSYWIALIYIGLGDKDQASAWLHRANRERSSWLAWVKVEPHAHQPLGSQAEGIQLQVA